MGIHRLNHAVLYVRDVERSVGFYRDVLGFRVKSRLGDQAAFLLAPDSANDHDLGLFALGAAAGDSLAGRSTVGLYHLAWEVDTLDELERRGQVLVLVPTVELLDQWVAQLEAWVGSRHAVGRMGGGHAGDLASHEVLVAVVNSARSLDVRPIRRGGLLVADECHRYGSAVNRLALDPRFSSRLGLSATYAREDDGTLAWLDPYFGGTCFRLGYRRAIADGATARFCVTLAGVRLSAVEAEIYEELSERMAVLRSRLLRAHGLPAEPFEAFLRAVVALADGAGPGSGLARAYRQAMLERRRLLADTPAKDRCLA